MPEGEWEKSVLLAFEREMLGLYVSDHPLLGVEHVLAAAADVSIATLQSEGVPDGQPVTVAGILSSVNRRVTKAGAPWARATLEDLEGSVEVLFFPATYAQVGINVVEDALVVIKGRPQARDDTVELIASDLSLPDLRVGSQGPVVVRMAPARCTPPMVERLREVLAAHPGYDRGPPAPGQRRTRAATARSAKFPGGRQRGADGRPEGAARSERHRLSGAGLSTDLARSGVPWIS